MELGEEEPEVCRGNSATRQSQSSQPAAYNYCALVGSLCVGAQTLLLEELVVRGQEEMFLPDPYENSGVIWYKQFNDSTPMIVTA